ncbi:MAG: hypothetical protein ACRD6N_13110 [Pyrinomonadaceae bacterium]
MKRYTLGSWLISIWRRQKERDRFNHALDIGRQVSRLRQARGPVPQGLRKAYYQEVPVLSRVKQYFGGDTTGKKVAPALLENMLKEHHLISQAMVYGEGKSYLVALNYFESGRGR